MKYGYVRISTREQDEARQVEAIKSAGIDEDNIIIEKSSGKNFIDRKKWQELMAKVVVGNVIVSELLPLLEAGASWEVSAFASQNIFTKLFG